MPTHISKPQPRNLPIKLRLVVMSFVVMLSISTLSHAANTRSNALTWLKDNQLAPHDGFMVNRVQLIFADVKKASDSVVHPSQLYIIQSNSIPWAIALEDNNIILTTGAIDVVYSGDDSLDKKDARMAFVLGHELRHVIENDYSHARAYPFSETGLSDLVSAVDKHAEARKKLELRADEEGLAYASLAGYDTSAIFSGVGGSANFLEYWANQTNTKNDKKHFTPSQRVQYLQESYENINSSVEFFKYGVRLAHFGDLNEAKILLDDFYKVYESGRVQTNRGYVHLQLAREAMPEYLAYEYWYPDLLELDSGFPLSAARTVDRSLPKVAIEHLNQAIRLLNDGLKFSDNDTTTRLNLISAHMFLGEYSAARAVMEKIDHWEDKPELLSIDAMIVMQNKRLKNPWDTFSLELLEQQASGSDAAPDLIYNYARLLEGNSRPDQAQFYWQRLAQNLKALPRNYRVMVCRELKDKSDCSKQIDQFEVKNSTWTLSVQPGDQINSRSTREAIADWNVKPIKSFSGVDAIIYPDGDGNSLLAVGGIVKLVTIKQHGIDSKNDLLHTFGSPEQIINTGTEQIWSYGSRWSALVSGNRVREVWVAR